MENSFLAIVGDGVASLVSYCVLVASGLPAEAISIYGPSPAPLACLGKSVHALRQTHMRSESGGHLSPYDWPGLAWRDAWMHRSPLPIFKSFFDLYNPSWQLIEEQAQNLIQEYRFSERHILKRIARVERTEAGYLLWNDQGDPVGISKQVLLALGHAGPNWPRNWGENFDRTLVWHAYEGRPISPGQLVVVIGGGISAAHTWLRALAAGAQVSALTRQPIIRQRLNVPRADFNRSAMLRYQALSQEERLAYLQNLGLGSVPVYFNWERGVAHYQKRKLFTSKIGSVSRVEPNGARLHLVLEQGASLDADQIILATGFARNPLAFSVVRDWNENIGLAFASDYLKVEDDFCLAPLCFSGHTCGVVGALATWALPVADTFWGIKYVARRLALDWVKQYGV